MTSSSPRRVTTRSSNDRGCGPCSAGGLPASSLYPAPIKSRQYSRKRRTECRWCWRTASRRASTIADAVTIDNFEAGEIAASHLAKMGHREVVIAASFLSFAPIRERVRGADSLLRHEFGRCANVVELGSNSERGAQIFAEWLDRHPHPTAILALTNVTTLAVLSALASRRIDVPKQISLIGFDDYAWMSARKTAVTAIRQPVDDMARTLWDRLKGRIGGDDAPPRRIELKTSLQIRDSVRDLRAKAESLPVLSREELAGPVITNKNRAM